MSAVRTFPVCRSVEDELKRESYTDASVVAVSYLVMLGYITFALAALPPPQQLLQLFVLSRAALGAGGVLIVAGAQCVRSACWSFCFSCCGGFGMHFAANEPVHKHRHARACTRHQLVRLLLPFCPIVQSALRERWACAACLACGAR